VLQVGDRSLRSVRGELPGQQPAPQHRQRLDDEQVWGVHIGSIQSHRHLTPKESAEQILRERRGVYDHT
jgi:hypothetical protein